MVALLREGSRGEDVKRLQFMLNRSKPSAPPLAEDGIFGPRTLARVREYQKAHDLQVDGIAGRITQVLLASTYTVVLPPGRYQALLSLLASPDYR